MENVNICKMSTFESATIIIIIMMLMIMMIIMTMVWTTIMIIIQLTEAWLLSETVCSRCVRNKNSIKKVSPQNSMIPAQVPKQSKK